MKARQLLENTAYGPETLTVLFQAFDEAWGDIEGNLDNSPTAAESARTRLATIILGLASEGASDPTALKNAALQAMALEYGCGFQ
jgi:hypothetical protein